MSDIAAAKEAARKAGFARRKAAFESKEPGFAGLLAEVLAGYRGVPLAGYMPIRTEIDPLAVMAEAAAHGPVGVPVIEGPARPLRFDLWEPQMPMKAGAFGAMVPEIGVEMVPEILIVPLVAFTRAGARMGYGGGFYDRTIAGLRARGAVLTIGFAFAGQEAGDLPVEPTDEVLDMIVTEVEVIELR